jgi:hypothetical protein
MKRPIFLLLSVLLGQTSFAQFITNTGIDISNSSMIVTNGDWTNDAATTITEHGIIITTESFVNNGKLDPTSKGGFILRYKTDLTFQPGGSNMGFLTKEGTGAALVSGSIGISDSLLIKSGIVRLLDPQDSMSLKSRAQLLVKTGAWIEGGLIARAGTGDLLFPFGKDGLYLPLKIYKMQAEKVTASIVDAPANHSAGPGVDAMIGFPYAWRVVGKVETDTAGYVEIDYPNTLPVVGNPIVVREVEGSKYASMGARLIEDSGSRTTVKSYSRRLNGLFTIAQGFPSDPVTDSLALVSLYHGTGGPEWIVDTNWLTGTIDTWFGVTVNGQSITAVALPGNNLSGPVADPLVDILSLQTIDLSGNAVTAIPDFTLNPEITTLNVSDNKLDFGSLEPNAGITGLDYLIQGDIGTPSDSVIEVGTAYQFALPSQGGNSQYQWKRNGANIAGANTSSYLLPVITRETMGEYTAQVTNANLPGLILKSATQKVLAYANISGKLFAETGVPANEGEMTLYRVQPGAFEPVKNIPVEDDGGYSFEKVLLDDYQILGFADTILHERALPTYYLNTIFWEEADTLSLTDHVNGLDIVSQLEPGPPSGRGSISGYFQEDDGTGRVDNIERSKRISSAGVSARRVERTGRTKEEILTLVAYVFTNEDGEFSLPNLPTGEYRINFQYPGYPMDETSYTTINIGTAFESQAMVEANVVDGKINVRKLVITGLYEEENYHADVFPNPAVDFIQLQFPGEASGRFITVSDMQGKIMHRIKAEEKDASVNVRSLPKGIYILNINEKGINVKTMKVMIE